MPQWPIQFHNNLDVPGVAPGVRKGRCLLEGYMRSCGLEGGNVPQLCEQDSDFRSAYLLARGRTIVTPYRLMNLYLLIRFYLPRLARGSIVELGSYRGGSAIFMAYLARRFLDNAPVFGFDTFAGMPASDQGIDVHRVGEFGGIDLPELRAYAKEYRLENLQFVEGLFQETLPKMTESIGRVALLHIDCDNYDAVKYCYEAGKELMAPGGYIVLDDPTTSTCMGAMEAMEELMIRRDGLHAEQISPHVVFRYPPLVAEDAE